MLYLCNKNMESKNKSLIVIFILLFISLAILTIVYFANSLNSNNNNVVDSNISVVVNEGPNFENTVWQATSISEKKPIPNTNLTVQFDNQGKVVGFDGCNNFNSTYTLNGENININPQMASTQKACPQEIMDQANNFTKLIISSTKYENNNGIMKLYQGNTNGLVFSGSTNPLAKTTWDINGYNNGKQAVVSPIINTNPNINFSDDGTVSGSTGCNTFTGVYSIDSKSITISKLASTQRECFEPEGIMKQETSILEYLEKAKTWNLQGNQLSLRTAEDQLAIIALSSN